MSGPEPTGGMMTGSARWFATTHWSVVLAAGEDHSHSAEGALDNLCRTYWYPLYAYVRREGYSAHDAQDLTQGFFERVLEKNYLAQADRERGRFRSFLLASLRHYLSDQRDRTRAAKRGGGHQHISLNDNAAEARYAEEPVDGVTAEKIFDRRWALTVLEQARARLRQEYVAAGKGELYQQVRVFETSQTTSLTYAELAARLGTTESAIKSAVPRMRRRYRELVREVIAHTVNDPAAVDDEIRHLLAAVTG